MTKKNYQEINQQQLALNKQFKAHSSDTLSAFGQLHRAAMAEGDLDVKTKELIALGIGIAHAAMAVLVHTWPPLSNMAQPNKSA